MKSPNGEEFDPVVAEAIRLTAERQQQPQATPTVVEEWKLTLVWDGGSSRLGGYGSEAEARRVAAQQMQTRPDIVGVMVLKVVTEEIEFLSRSTEKENE